MREDTQMFKFQIGRVVITATAEEELNGHARAPEVREAVSGLLARHRRGDWGDVDEHDAYANEQGLMVDERIMSLYTLYGVRLYVITDAATTVCPSCTAGIGECENESGSWHGDLHYRDDLPPRRLLTTIMLPSDY